MTIRPPEASAICRRRAGNMPLQVIGDRRFPSRVLLLLLFLLLSGLFAVTVATYGVERELYLPVELFHPLFVP